MSPCGPHAHLGKMSWSPLAQMFSYLQLNLLHRTWQGSHPPLTRSLIQSACSQNTDILPSRALIQAEGPKLSQICSPSPFKDHTKMLPSVFFLLPQLRGAEHPVSPLPPEPPASDLTRPSVLQGLLHGDTQETRSCS